MVFMDALCLPSQAHRTALMAAADEGHLAVTEALLVCGADVNAKSVVRVLMHQHVSELTWLV